ncbi:MAG: hypothetical protein KatS3mg061_0789 [Dehalococcoidia bacterium]|nr:MAG: hypothetical protein KatS3mg061_0789 [Dehalococcoidia bacterium]
MVQAPERPAASAREELRAVLAAFRQASANLRQEVRLVRERRLSAVQAADQQRASARAAAEQAFRRITAIYERARSTLLGTSRLSQADRTTRLELLLGGFSGLGEVSLEPNASDPAREITLQADRAETALRYIRQALGLDGDDLRQGTRLAARLLAGLVIALGCSLVVSSLVLGAMAGVTLAGMVVLVIGLAGTLVLPTLASGAASDLRTPAAAFDQLARALAQARRAYRRWNEEIEATHERRVREAESAYQQAIELLQPLFTQATSDVTPALSALQERLGPWLLEWSDERWASWAPPSEPPPVVRLGSLLAGTAPYQLEVPAFLTLPPGRPLLLKSAPTTHPQASGALTALLARLLATFPPAQLSFSLIDPLGHGQSLAPFLQLADYDDQLVRGRVWVGLDEIEDELGALLDEVSHAPASSTAPGQRLHLVVVLNFPEGFSELAAMRLWRLFQQGPSAGVWPLVLVDLGRPLPVGFKLADLEREATVIGSRAGRFLFEEEGLSDCELRLDPPPPAPPAHAPGPGHRPRAQPSPRALRPDRPTGRALVAGRGRTPAQRSHRHSRGRRAVRPSRSGAARPFTWRSLAGQRAASRLSCGRSLLALPSAISPVKSPSSSTTVVAARCSHRSPAGYPTSIASGLPAPRSFP